MVFYGVESLTASRDVFAEICFRKMGKNTMYLRKHNGENRKTSRFRDRGVDCSVYQIPIPQWPIANSQ